MSQRDAEVMINPHYVGVLRRIHARLQNAPICWVITGSLGLAVQGLDVAVHDIDLQTDQQGAYAIERLLADYCTTPVRFSATAHIRSHFGMLMIDGVQVEIMGNIEKQCADGSWEGPINVPLHRRWVVLDGVQLPVMSLAYEYYAYRMLGRHDTAAMLKGWLDRKGDSTAP